MKQWSMDRLWDNMDRIARRDFEQKKGFGSAYLVNVGGRRSSDASEPARSGETAP